MFSDRVHQERVARRACGNTCLVDEETAVLCFPAVAPIVVLQLIIIDEVIVHVIQVIEAALILLLAHIIIFLAADTYNLSQGCLCICVSCCFQASKH